MYKLIIDTSEEYITVKQAATVKPLKEEGDIWIDNLNAFAAYIITGGRFYAGRGGIFDRGWVNFGGPVPNTMKTTNKN